jgi:hypothetical protein
MAIYHIKVGFIIHFKTMENTKSTKSIKSIKEKSFEEVLAELDQMIEADMLKFKEALDNLSVRENTNAYFEQEETLIEEFETPQIFSNLAENQTNFINSDEDSRLSNYVQDSISD